MRQSPRFERTKHVGMITILRMKFYVPVIPAKSKFAWEGLKPGPTRNDLERVPLINEFILLLKLLLEYANSLKAVTNGQKGVADVCALMDCTELADEGDGVSDDEGDHDDKAGGECASSSHQLYKMARETFERFEKTLDRLIPCKFLKCDTRLCFIDMTCN